MPSRWATGRNAGLQKKPRSPPLLHAGIAHLHAICSRVEFVWFDGLPITRGGSCGQWMPTEPPRGGQKSPVGLAPVVDCSPGGFENLIRHCPALETLPAHRAAIPDPPSILFRQVRLRASQQCQPKTNSPCPLPGARRAVQPVHEVVAPAVLRALARPLGHFPQRQSPSVACVPHPWR